MGAKCFIPGAGPPACVWPYCFSGVDVRIFCVFHGWLCEAAADGTGPS